MADHIELGKEGEIIAVDYLQKKGFQILASQALLSSSLVGYGLNLLPIQRSIIRYLICAFLILDICNLICHIKL